MESELTPEDDGKQIHHKTTPNPGWPEIGSAFQDTLPALIH